MASNDARVVPATKMAHPQFRRPSRELQIRQAVTKRTSGFRSKRLQRSLDIAFQSKNRQRPGFLPTVPPLLRAAIDPNRRDWSDCSRTKIASINSLAFVLVLVRQELRQLDLFLGKQLENGLAL